MSETLRLTRAQTARLIEITAAATPHRLPLIRALCHGLLGIVEVARGATLEASEVENNSRPIVAIIGDDDYKSTGPAGFPAAPVLLQWAKAAIVHAAGGEPQHYERAVDGALLMRRLILVETDSTHAAQWTDFLGGGKGMPIFSILPRDGVHPVIPAVRQ